MFPTSRIVVTAFGITGDLMRLKIIPALFEMYQQGAFAPGSVVVGISRKQWDNAALRQHIRTVIEPHATGIAVEHVEAFLELFYIAQGDGNDDTLYKKIAAIHSTVAQPSYNQLWLLAVEPSLYATIATNLATHKLVPKPGGNAWKRVMLEKPFGLDGTSAELLQTALTTVFDEAEIYRTDHYLAKEFMPKPFNREALSAITVRAYETVGLEKRGEFYDEVGALRDVGQSHLLLVLASILAHTDGTTDAESARAKRAHVVELLPTLSAADTGTHTMRAQYTGYRDIAGVAPNSKTETFFRVHFTLPIMGHAEVAVTIESGKALPGNQKEVVCTYKDGTMTTMPIASGAHSEYQKLLMDCIQGDQRLFVSIEEVRALWRFVGPIRATWDSGTPPLAVYEKGTLPN